jgi:formylmethanofuran dehydrogenase subunit A
MIDCCIRGGTVHDPANGVNGDVKDLWIAAGRIVEPPSADAKPSKTIDARGMIVFPGGVDMHTHLAGPKVNAARGMRPEEKRDGQPGSTPTTRWTGLKYAGLGFTTAVDAAVAPLFARQAHLELANTPMIDKGFLALVGNNVLAMECIRDGDKDHLDSLLRWLLSSTGGYGFKAVNPGGVEHWKETGRRTLVDLDSQVDQFKISPRAIVRELAAAVDRLKLPHPLHVHCNNLGVGGNVQTTLATIDAIGESRAHLAHAQFHSYAGSPDDDGSIFSAVPMLVDRLRKSPNISLDVGHVTFGPTTSLTGDSALGHFLHRVKGEKWFSADVECEGGCGIVPIEYKHRSLFHSVQWAAGLEWYLLMDDPWRIGFSTDHPNGGVFWRYPETLSLLMSKDRRREMIERLHPKLRERSTIAEIDREYTLNDIAILTRAAPAKILGLKNKGHLGAGADADVTIYQPNDNSERMFSFPRYVLKAGRVVIDAGEVIAFQTGETFAVEVDETAATTECANTFERNYSIALENYGLRPEEKSRLQTVRPT